MSRPALNVERLTRVLRTLWLTPDYIDADASENGYRTIAEAIASEYDRFTERCCVECGQPWPCAATVARAKDGIPHRLGASL